MKKKGPDLRDKELIKLGNRIRQLRIEKGHTNYENFAFDNDISRSQYGRYEKGESDLQYLTLLRIVKALGMSMEEFFSEGFD